MKRGEKWFPVKLLKICPNHSLYAPRKADYGRFRARITKGGIPSEIACQSIDSKIVYREVGADFEKTKF